MEYRAGAIFVNGIAPSIVEYWKRFEKEHYERVARKHKPVIDAMTARERVITYFSDKRNFSVTVPEFDKTKLDARTRFLFDNAYKFLKFFDTRYCLFAFGEHFQIQKNDEERRRESFVLRSNLSLGRPDDLTVYLLNRGRFYLGPDEFGLSCLYFNPAKTVLTNGGVISYRYVHVDRFEGRRFQFSYPSPLEDPVLLESLISIIERDASGNSMVIGGTREKLVFLKKTEVLAGAEQKRLILSAVH